MKKANIKEAQVKISSVFNMEGSVLKGNVNGICKGFDIHLFVISNESDETITNLIQMAHNSCFLENTLANPTNIQFKNYLNGNEIDI
jgi:organic hydroperoxide reductase OsmC/OhrA